MKVIKLEHVSENPRSYLDIYWINDRILLQKWQGLWSEPYFQSAIDNINKLLVRHLPAEIIIDLRSHIRITPTMRAYAANMISGYVATHFSKAYPGRIFKEVLIMPLDLLVLASVQGYLSMIKETVQTIQVKNMKDACLCLDLHCEEGVHLERNNQSS